MIAANAKIYQNTNPIFELTLKDQSFNLINLKDATKHNILVVRPSGHTDIWEADIIGDNFETLSYKVKSYTEVSYTPAVYDGNGNLITPAITPVPAHTDLYEVGFYTLAPQIELSGLTIIGESFQIQVYKFGL